MWVQIRLLGPSLLPDKSPDNAVEAEIDYEAGIWKTKQGGLSVMNPGRLLINLIDCRSSCMSLGEHVLLTFSSEPPWYVVPDSFSLSRNVPKILSYGVPLSP